MKRERYLGGGEYTKPKAWDWFRAGMLSGASAVLTSPGVQGRNFCEHLLRRVLQEQAKAERRLKSRGGGGSLLKGCKKLWS
jgi:hypothetical protein